MFLRPATATVLAERTAVPGLCDQCGEQALQRYRTLSEGGWWDVVKCRNCLHSHSRTPGPLLGPLTAATQALIPVARPKKP